jgi:hypothetical protein
MKALKITYWATTAIIGLMMLFSAYAYMAKPEMKAGFEHLGYPGYFRIELAIAKIIGVILLLVPVHSYLKQMAYAGFGIVFISAFIAHTSAGDPVSMRIAPLIFLGLLAVSYYTHIRQPAVQIARK